MNTGGRVSDGGLRSGDSSATIARNAFHLVLGQVATTALAIFFSAALGRFLGAADFGVFFLITTTSTFAYVLVEWGQPLFVIRELAKEPPRAGDLIGTALALRVAFAALATVPVALIAWALGYGVRTTWLSVGMMVALLPISLAQGYGMAFRARDQMGRDALVSVLNKGVTLGITLPALALGMGISGVVLAQGIAGAIALAVALQLYASLRATPLRASRQTARELLVGGAPILAMTAAISVQPYLDAVILSMLAPATAVGWFGAAKTILGTLMAPATIIGAAAYPRLARLSEDAAALRREVSTTLRPLLWLGALAATGTYLFAGAAIDLIYGSAGFGPAATILKAAAPGVFLVFIDTLLGITIYACGRGTGFAIAKVASVIVGTGLNFLLIPVCQDRFGNGGIGVVVGFAISEVVVTGGALFVLRRGTLQATAGLDLLRALAAAGATLLAFYAFPPAPLWVGIPVCVIVFAAASLGLGLMGRRDLVLLWYATRNKSGSAVATAVSRHDTPRPSPGRDQEGPKAL